MLEQFEQIDIYQLKYSSYARDSASIVKLKKLFMPSHRSSIAKVSTLFKHTNLQGGDKYYNKYLKYKQKYIDLKNTNNE